MIILVVSLLSLTVKCFKVTYICSMTAMGGAGGGGGGGLASLLSGGLGGGGGGGMLLLLYMPTASIRSASFCSVTLLFTRM